VGSGGNGGISYPSARDSEERVRSFPSFFESGRMAKGGGSGVGVPRFRYGFCLLLKFSGPQL